MASFLAESLLLLPCFGAAFALTKIVDRLFKHHMSHFSRGIFTLIVSVGFLMAAAVASIVVGCRFSSCDL
jgi:hypothetical protein